LWSLVHGSCRPEPLVFDPFNTWLAGISEDDVKDQPTFDWFWANEFRPYFQTGPIIAHNASFDVSVLRHVLDQYGIEYPQLIYYCTRVIAKKTWPGLCSCALDVVADHLDIEFRHHDPREDATAAAKIARYACEAQGVDSLHELSNTLKFHPGELYPGGYLPCAGPRSAHSGHSGAPGVRLNTLTAETSDFDCEHPFYDKLIVFTGALDSMTRLDAAQRVINCGGRCADTMSRWVNYLVLGQQDYRKLKGETKSGKMRKAEELLLSGADIEVIPESDFLEMLQAG
jgi:DNA polymerase III subunit epsilon